MSKILTLFEDHNIEESVILEKIKHMNPCYLDIKDVRGRTILYWAVIREFINIIKYLSGKVNVNEKEYFGCTPLMMAVYNGNPEVIYELLKFPNIDVNIDVNIRNNCASHITIPNIDVNIRNNCDSHITIPNIDVNIRNNCNSTALITAVTNNKISSVKILLDHFGSAIDINVQNDYGKTARQYAIDNNYQDIINLLDSHEKC